MPTMVKGEDGRELHENLSDSDAAALARNVHAATGETVTLIPYKLVKGAWVLDEKNATTVGAPVEEDIEEAPAVEKPKRPRASRAKK